MAQGICKNKNCNRLIYDTEKLDELPDKIECQHCHHLNVIRRGFTCSQCGATFASFAAVGRHAKEHKGEKAGGAVIPPEPEPEAVPEPEAEETTEESAPEPEDLPVPVPEESAEEVE